MPPKKTGTYGAYQGYFHSDAFTTQSMGKAASATHVPTNNGITRLRLLYSNWPMRPPPNTPIPPPTPNTMSTCRHISTH